MGKQGVVIPGLDMIIKTYLSKNVSAIMENIDNVMSEETI